MSKGNIHKKETWEDKFDRKAWMFWKKRNRKIFRKKKKEELRDYGDYSL